VISCVGKPLAAAIERALSILPGNSMSNPRAAGDRSSENIRTSLMRLLNSIASPYADALLRWLKQRQGKPT